MFPSPGVPPSNCAGETLRCKDGTGLGHHGQARSQYQDPVAEPGPLGKTGRDSVFLPRALPALTPSHPHSAGQGPFWRLPHPGGGTHRAGLQWPPRGSLTRSAECAVVRVARSQETLQSTKNARFSSVSCPRAVCRRVSIRRHTGFEDPCHVDQEPHVPRYPKSQSGTDLPQESTMSRGSCARPVPVTMTLPRPPLHRHEQGSGRQGGWASVSVTDLASSLSGTGAAFSGEADKEPLRLCRTAALAMEPCHHT